MFRSSCLICDSKNLERIIDLGMHPFADTFIPVLKLSESEPVYPLSCDLCNNCGQIQTSCITSPAERYSFHDYSYTSSNSLFARNHWEDYANVVLNKLNIKKDSFIVEVGSNDGYLSERFLNKGHKVLGVDPSQYMADLAKRRGVETLVDFFDLKTSEEIQEKYGKADLIIANNVFNHSNYPFEFAKATSNLLASKGTFVFESPYWISGLESRHFDQIYHEHVSYFTVKSSSKILNKADMKIFDAGLVDYHGGAIRVFAKKNEDCFEDSCNEKTMIENENALKVFNKKTYEDFMDFIINQRNQFLEEIYGLKKQNKPIIAVGAAAKGNTFLNFYNLDNSIIDYVTDASPHKQGKYTPLTRIPICSDDVFANYNEVYGLILSWNISDKLKKILENINPKINFLSPFKQDEK